MQIRVDTYTGHRGMPMPQRFRLGRSRIGIVETLDQWFGPDYRYIKVKGGDRAEIALDRAALAKLLAPVFPGAAVTRFERVSGGLVNTNFKVVLGARAA